MPLFLILESMTCGKFEINRVSCSMDRPLATHCRRLGRLSTRQWNPHPEICRACCRWVSLENLLPWEMITRGASPSCLARNKSVSKILSGASGMKKSRCSATAKGPWNCSLLLGIWPAKILLATSSQSSGFLIHKSFWCEKMHPVKKASRIENL